MVDLDGDGRRDVLSGSWPGEVYWFRGTARGFARPIVLFDTAAHAIDPGDASTAFAVDWDGDGDLDLLLGDIEGRIQWARNESGDRTLAFSPPVPIERDGTALNVGIDSAPVAADWDGDGRLDLIVGNGAGEVQWFARQADGGLAGPVTLVEAPPEGAQRGERAKPCVADWNGDGRLDLIVGDYSSREEPPAGSTAEQAARIAAAAEEQREIEARVDRRRERIEQRVYAEAGVKDPAEADPDVLVTAYERVQAALDADRTLSAYQMRLAELDEILAAREARDHGYVWVYLRQP